MPQRIRSWMGHLRISLFPAKKCKEIVIGHINAEILAGERSPLLNNISEMCVSQRRTEGNVPYGGESGRGANEERLV